MAIGAYPEEGSLFSELLQARAVSAMRAILKERLDAIVDAEIENILAKAKGDFEAGVKVYLSHADHSKMVNYFLKFNDTSKDK